MRNDGSPKKITITTKEGDTVTPLDLTVELYNEKVKSHAIKKPTFETYEELRSYYLKHNFSLH